MALRRKHTLRRAENLPATQSHSGTQLKSLFFDYFFVRKVMLVKYSYAYIVFPGGFGTFDELFEALTLVQTGKIFPISIILVGVDFWTPMMEFLKKSPLELGTISPQDLDLIKLTDDPEEAIMITKQNIINKLDELEKEGLQESKVYQGLLTLCSRES